MFFTNCENDIEKVKELTARQDSAIVSARNIEIKYTTKGKKDLLMQAPLYLQFYKSEEDVQHEFPEGIKMFFYDDNGNITSSIKANYSIYYEKKGIWEAKYDVVAVNEKNEQLNTEYLIWDQNEETISSDQFVKMTTEDGIIYGDGFESNQKLTSWEVVNGRGVINIEDPEKTP